MAKERIERLFTVAEFGQLSFIYQQLDEVPIINSKKEVSHISSAFHQTDKYVLQPHHKPLSKIIDWSIIENE